MLHKVLNIQTISPSGYTATREDSVIQEERIAFFLNNQKLLSVMSLPKDQESHIVGFLLSEGVIDNVDQISSIKVSENGLSVNIEANIDKSKLDGLFKEKTLTSGCCVGVAGNLEENVIEKFVNTNYKVSTNRIFELLRQFEQSSELFNLTGCVHKAMLVLEYQTLISEDIGRHNAIDKVMGKAALNKLDKTDSILFVSGRLSLEMVIKAVMHNIPIVVSKAAATYMGVKAAQETGVTLIGFARGNNANVYTHSGRITT
ncbi:formate dehydrogenase accessory sulfurtransferase FdhD [Helicobacter sp. WB40]|uniref:formate dehydrogenase accessory sulfurtransferase FdhD n=1 Tax=Helicobacter sp. WB40 TaxID=3004130 RepID=UPI0022EBB9B3|nr:formate dehydrogenase accessory sulfurtransferase FdhD [Helicobacter sp. WB40]MDA3966593.1 formate dehydrogenase accessory sulfurtransferase FdhD [Helicobacter sp. WB40]